MLRIHPDEHPVSVQLFGPDPDAMRQAAAMAADAGADLIDLNMGCPVPKVVKTGAGAALLEDPDLAVAIARAAREGAQGRPVTVKLRSGMRRATAPASTSPCGSSRRPASRPSASTPRSANVHHSGSPDYALAASSSERSTCRWSSPAACADAERARDAYEESGADAVMLARGALGNPWLFEELTGARDGAPEPRGDRRRARWLIDRAEEHWGPERATRNLRKLYPPYLERLGVRGRRADAFMRMRSLDEVRARLRDAWDAAPMRRLRRLFGPGNRRRYNRAPCPTRVRREASRSGVLFVNSGRFRGLRRRHSGMRLGQWLANL